jgi:hypothetical protein
MKPTPTQAENDRTAMGEHILQHEDDGSGPDQFAEQNAAAQAGHVTRQIEGGKQSETYKTRQTKTEK